MIDAGLAGLGAPFDCLECLEEVDTFLLIPPYFRILSAPALAFEDDLATVVFTLGKGVLGPFAGGTPPFCTACTVCSSAAVPLIPMRK